MGLSEEPVAEPGHPSSTIRKRGLLASGLIPYGTFTVMLREYEMIVFPINSVSSFTISTKNCLEYDCMKVSTLCPSSFLEKLLKVLLFNYFELINPVTVHYVTINSEKNKLFKNNC